MQNVMQMNVFSQFNTMSLYYSNGLTLSIFFLFTLLFLIKEFHWDMYFRQFWNDDRLNFENKGSSKVEQVKKFIKPRHKGPAKGDQFCAS